MYYTFKKNERYKYVDTIDALFNSSNVQIQFEDNDLERYQTSIVDILPLDKRISDEQLRVATIQIKNLATEIENPEEEYIEFKIPKKTKGFRTIKAPKPNLKTAQKKAANILQYYLKVLPHDSAWAYTKGRDVVGAVKEHTNNKSKWYLKIDLKDFFGSCNSEFITRQLKDLYPFAIMSNSTQDAFITSLLRLAIKDGSLPQGTPLSPILTNLIMVSIDYKINKAINKLVKDNIIFKQRYVYTRYADDIIISAKCSFDFKQIIEAIELVLKDTPLVINKDKTRYGSSAGRNWNLGIMCNKDGDTTIGYKRKREIKAVVHNYFTSRTAEPWSLEDLRWLLGQLSWLQNVEPNYFKGFRKYLSDKYNTDIKDLIILDIKNYNN